MSKKYKFSKEIKLNVVMEYINGDGSSYQLAEKYGCNHKTVLEWVNKYEKLGESSFNIVLKNNLYTSEFKEMVVKEYLEGKVSNPQLTLKYNISNK